MITTLASARSLKGLRIKQDPPQGEITVPQSAILPLIRRLDLEELHVDVWGLGEPDSGMSFGWDFLGSVETPTPDEGDRGSPRLNSLRFPIWRPERIVINPFRLEVVKKPPEYPPLATLKSIAELSGLRRIRLSVDSSKNDGDTFTSLLDGWAPKSTSPSTLRHLELADVRSESTPLTAVQCRDIARFLGVIFPNLESLHMAKDEGRNTACDKQWEVIEEIRSMRRELQLLRSGSAGK